ncbi:phenylacetate--CoA ligase family protein [Phycisphaerales bacterium AB-hyl4]|uniref:Phenylacetate--CoA ligase family protein n=1 Tax=Natronomicrosphaera hydrolytica TaxID=3242702 RepID=A0ABV4U667_9BACT
MNYLAQCQACISAHYALKYDFKQIRRIQWQRLRRLVTEAYLSIPYYRQRLDEAGVEPSDLQSLDDLHRLPVMTKADFQSADPRSLLSQRILPARLVREQTSGSSGRPFVMYFDEAYRRMRKALFLRALVDCGYRPGQRLLIVTSREKTGVPAWMGWRYVSYKDPPHHNIEQHNSIRPHVLYGWVTPMRQMAEVIRNKGLVVHRPNVLITTAETLDPPTHRLLGEAFGCPVYEIYGLTETGTVAWQSPSQPHFRISHESMIVEFLSGPDAGPARRLVVTNLGLRSMPFIRYDTGDLAIPIAAQASATATDAAATLPAIERVDGRHVDCVRLGDGRIVSPFELTTAMEAVPGVSRYQIVQERTDVFTVRYVPGGDGDSSAGVTEQAARNVLGEVVGTDVQINVQAMTSLDPPPGQKFRVVQSRLAQAHTEGVLA